jgi:bifunctional DNase/RNase
VFSIGAKRTDYICGCRNVMWLMVTEEKDGEIRVGVLGVYKVKGNDQEEDVVFLVDESNRMVLPIWIGEPEAMSIQLALQGVKPQRPITHDLIANMLEELGYEMDKVKIDGLIKSVFTATIYLKQLKSDRVVKIDARPSDSIAIALRTGCQIYVDRSLEDQMIPKDRLKLPEELSTEKDEDEYSDDEEINSPYGP